MDANRMLRCLAVLLCAVSMSSAPGAAQNPAPPVPVVAIQPPVSPFVVATQPVAPLVVTAPPELPPLVNLYWQQQSRIRLGLYLDADQSRRFDRDGALITGVMRNSPADEAGLEEGDVITVFDGHVLTIPLPDSDVGRDLDLDISLPAQRLLALAGDLEKGQVVEVRYLRDGANNTVSVEADEFEFPEVRSFGAAPGVSWGRGGDGNAEYLRTYENFGRDLTARMRVLGDRLGELQGNFQDSDLADRLMVLGDRLGDLQVGVPGAFNFSYGVTSTEGVEFIELNPELGEYFGTATGVLVVEVDEDSTLGLLAGDVVLAVGAREAETVGRVLRLIRSYDEDEPIRFRVMRQGSELVAEGVRR